MSDTSVFRNEWKNGWPLAVASLSGMAVASIALYLIGPLIEPLEAEFGWSRAKIMLGLTVSTIAGALLGPLVGVWLDRWGPRRIGLPGALLTLTFLAMLSLANDNYALWLALWLLISLGTLGVMPTVWTLATASSFEKSRGLAIAVAMCGASVAALVVPNLSTWLMDTYGWRSAVPLVCALIGLALLPVMWFGLHSKADEARRSRAKVEAQAAAPAPLSPGVTNVRRAVTSPQFIKLAIAAFIFTVCTLGLVASMVPVMTSFGFSRAEAAGIAGLLGLASFSGRIATGFLIDRYDSGVIAGSVVLLPVIACLLLLNVDGSALTASAAVLILGLALGAEVDVVAFLAAEKFGTARYGTIFSFISSAWTMASALGPLIVSYVYDLTDSYALAIQWFIPFYVITSLLLFFIGKPLPFDQTTQS